MEDVNPGLVEAGGRRNPKLKSRAATTTAYRATLE